MDNRNEELEPRYVISVAARMLNTQTHTLRYYEKVGIIEPVSYTHLRAHET